MVVLKIFCTGCSKKTAYPDGDERAPAGCPAGRVRAPNSRSTQAGKELLQGKQSLIYIYDIVVIQ